MANGPLDVVMRHIRRLAAATTDMFLHKLKSAAGAFLVLSVVAAGAGWAASQGKPPPAAERFAADKQTPPAPVIEALEEKQTRTDRYGDPLPPGALARLGTIRLRHAGWVSGAAYSPDGKLLASGGWDERVRLWDAETGKELWQFNLSRKGQGASPTNGVAFSPDGKMLAAGGWGTELALWDVASGKEIRRQQGVTRYVVFSPDSRMVVLGGFDNGGAELLELPSNKRRRIPLGWVAIHAVAFSPDGKLLATSGPKNQVILWDAASLKELRSCRGHQEEVRSLDFAPDGKQLVSGGMDKTIRLWDVASGKEIRCFQTTGRAGVDGVRYSPDGKAIAARSDGRSILLLDVKSGKKLRQLIGYGGGFSFPMAFSPDGKKLLGVQGNALQVWETATGKELFPASGIRESIDKLAYAADGRTLATVSEEGTIRLWDTATHRELRRFGGQQPGTRSLAFSADGRPRRQRLTRPEWEICWRDLADPDARRAYRALQALAADLEQSANQFKQRVRAVAPPDAKRTAELIRQLDSVDFAERTKAEEELAKQGESVRPALEQTLKEKPSLEVRRRIGQLLEQLEPEHSPEQLRLLRVVEAVEQMRTPEARRLLETWSSGIATARLTREAKAAVDRLRRLRAVP